MWNRVGKQIIRPVTSGKMTPKMLVRGGCRNSVSNPLNISAHARLKLSTVTPRSAKEIEPPAWWLMGLIGTGAGCFGAIMGLAGGVVIVPALVTFTNVPQKMAIGTSLMAAIVVGGVGSLSYAKEGLVDVVNAAVIATGSALTAKFGAQFAQGLPDRTLKTVLGIYMLVMAGVVPARKALLASAWNDRADDNVATKATATSESKKGILERTDLLVYFTTGLFAGFASGLFGIAGGTIVTPTLAVVSGLTQPQVLGTSLTAGLVPTIIAARSYYLGRNVLLRSVPAIAVGAALGAAVGSKLALQMSDENLRWCFSGGMTLLGLRVLLTRK